MAWTTPEPLSALHDVEPFACGKPVLDRWLKARALRNQREGFTAVNVLHEGMRVVGYYGVAPTAVLPTSAPRIVRTGQPPNPIPCLLIGQLAIDRAWAGRGLGSVMLAHALRRCVAGSELIGGRAVAVRALDEQTAAFWAHNGFLPSRDDPLLLFRSLPEIALTMRRWSKQM